MSRASLRSDPRLRGRGRHRSPWTPRRLAPRAWYDAELGQPKYVGYVQLNGGSTDNISTPDSALNSFSNDIEVIMRVRPDDWTTGATQTLCGKYLTTGNQRSWRFYVSAAGAIGLTASVDGTAVTTIAVTPTTPFVDAEWIWLRLRLDLTNGANSVGTIDIAADTGNNYTIPTSWTTNGTNTGTTIAGVFNGTGAVEIGSFGNGVSERLAGRVGRCIVKAGFDGTTTSDFNADDCFGDGYTHTDGYRWTLGIPKIYDCSGNNVAPAVFGSGTNQPLWLPWDGTPSVYLPGVTGNYVSCPDAAPLDITGDLEIVARVAMSDWTPGYNQSFVAKWNTGGNQACALQCAATTGRLRLYLSTTGSDLPLAESTVAPTVSDGSALWVKATFRLSDRRTQFFTAPDQAAEPTTWTQLGSDVTHAATSIWAGSAAIEIGTVNVGSSSALTGEVYRAIVRNGIGGTTVADFDASLCGQSGYTDAQGNPWTVNRSTSGRKTVVQSGAAKTARSVILLGTDDYIDVPAAAVPTFGIADAGSVLIAERQHSTQVNYRRIFSTEAANNQGLQIAARDGSSVSIGGFFGDSVGPTLVGGDIANIAMGTRTVVSMSVSGRSATGITLRANAANPVTVNNAAVGAVPVNSPSRIGAPAFTTTPFAEFEFESLITLDDAVSAIDHSRTVEYYNGGL